ncbi:MAG: bifunctional metallophosphatase/5'-nucleotidase [Saprospiraceae bacterium]|nr:bifunctional metallophosphatase/5'-nucleotidase [Saprospiraceae bacterium]MBP9210238.1 bifunctional metallophosphatase/5'-nucleotidase [Saprospiraceae bacterium]
MNPSDQLFKSFRYAFALVALVAMLATGACTHRLSGDQGNRSGKQTVHFAILQLNDFYEIAPLEGGKVGGAARIATVRKRLLREHHGLLTVLAGDFLSPSLLGTLPWEGGRVRGRHMVEVLNAVGVDLVCFGNHEFDLDESSLLQRMGESKFDWVSTNTMHLRNGKAQPFAFSRGGQLAEVPRHRIIRLRDQSGRAVRVGFVAPCLPANRAPYVHYEDFSASVGEQLSAISDSVDFVVSLSHLNLDDDLSMAKRFPRINLILGGHEHENMLHRVGKTILTKADANAKSLYLHEIQFEPGRKTFEIKSTLIPLNEQVALDPEVQSLVDQWKQTEFSIIRKMGFNPEAVLFSTPEAFDAREQVVRNEQCAMGSLIARAMWSSWPKTDVALFNSGSIRVDDVLAGKLTQYDILRALPYGGKLVLTEMNGALLHRILEVGFSNRGSGGYLQYTGIVRDPAGTWNLSDGPLKPSSRYRIVLNDFLLTGKEKGLDFLTRTHPELKILSEGGTEGAPQTASDIRMAIIHFIGQGGR